MLGLAHVAVLVGSVYLAAQIRFLGYAVPLNSDYSFVFPKALFFAFAILPCLSAMGIYRPQRQDRHIPVLIRVIAAMVLATITLVIFFYVFPDLYLGRGILFLSLLLGAAGLVLVQMLFYMAVDQKPAPWRVLFYGAGKNAAETLAYMRRRSDHSLFQLIGCVSAPGEEPGVGQHLLIDPGPSLADYARRHRIDEIVVTMDDRRDRFPADELIDCRISGISISDTLTFYERQTGKVKTELLQPSWIIFSSGFRQNVIQDIIKRVIDFVAALLLTIVALPLMLITAALIIAEDGFGKPVLFSQKRVGLRGAHYWIYKFRSMRTDAEVAGKAQWAIENDPRVTRVGFYIRKYRLDELPQLWNVLRGDMSLVGPRPERPEFVEQLIKNLPYYRVRECVRPGITGWAQLGYPYGASEDDANGKLQLDLYYVKNRSVFLDMLILINTVEVVLFRKGGR
ncbi:MAG: TIGR03013 family PEP-CTERM/XrtA system glycosyltransferase [Salinisphaera sp.]|nr:TIGR03013 family PEP-CTERM/XrtA system glycosyltransferase [Salinisphaera sp.]